MSPVLVEFGGFLELLFLRDRESLQNHLRWYDETLHLASQAVVGRDAETLDGPATAAHLHRFGALRANSVLWHTLKEAFPMRADQIERHQQACAVLA